MRTPTRNSARPTLTVSSRQTHGRIGHRGFMGDSSDPSCNIIAKKPNAASPHGCSTCLCRTGAGRGIVCGAAKNPWLPATEARSRAFGPGEVDSPTRVAQRVEELFLGRMVNRQTRCACRRAVLQPRARTPRCYEWRTLSLAGSWRRNFSIRYRTWSRLIPSSWPACVWFPPARLSACISSSRSTSSRFRPSGGNWNR